MANIDVQRSQGSQRQGGALSRPGGWEPFSSISPSEFFSNPFSLMRRMSDEMDRAFGRMLGRGVTEMMGGFPAIEVAEHDGNLCVHADVPGMKPEDVKVEMTEDSLIIRGQRKSEHEHRDENTYRSERQYGEFYRQIPLPQGANADQAKANFNNGVLEISVPVPKEASKRREIPVTSGTPAAASAAAGAGRTQE